MNNFAFFVKKTLKRKNTLQISIDNKEPVYLHSSIDVEREARRWCDAFPKQDYTAYMVFGAGLGYHVDYLQRMIPKSSVVFLFSTPEEKMLVGAKQYASPLNRNMKNLYWISLGDLYDVSVQLANLMLNKKMKKIVLCPYRPAMNLSISYYENCMLELVERIGNCMMLKLNLLFTTGKTFIRNYCDNILAIAENSGIVKIQELLKTVDTAIVVGAGPSLDKNIEQIKQFASSAVIIAAGSALGPLHKAGIVPHILMVADATEAMFLAVKEVLDPRILLVATYTINHRIIEEHTGPICFVASPDQPQIKLNKMMPKTKVLHQAASVSTLAVDFARECGLKKIVLVGQDLALPEKLDEAHHAQGGRGLRYDYDTFIRVPAYYGGSVRSFSGFKAILDFFAAYTKEYSNLTFINATEGGAYIPGMIHAPLASIEVKGKMTYFTKDDLKEQEINPRIIDELVVIYRELNEFIEIIKRSIDQRSELKSIEYYQSFYKYTLKKNQLLEKMLEPRLQGIEFFAQEDVATEELIDMHQQVTDDLITFADEIRNKIGIAVLEVQKKVGIDGEQSEDSSVD